MTNLSKTTRTGLRSARRFLDVDGLTAAVAFAGVYFIASAAMIAAA